MYPVENLHRLKSQETMFPYLVREEEDDGEASNHKDHRSKEYDMKYFVSSRT